MSMAAEPRQFGRRENRIVVSTNGTTREYRISASLLIICAVLFSTFMAGYIGATAYLAFREDLVAGTVIRQARMKHEYEDRIAALRAEVDRITSRQLLDQQAVEAKVAALMRQQEQLTGRNGALEGLLEKARERGIDIPLESSSSETGDRAAVPAIDPVTTASTSRPPLVLQPEGPTAALAGMPIALRGSAIGSDRGQSIALDALPQAAMPSRPRENLLAGVKEQIRSIEAQQLAGLLALKNATQERISDIAGIYRDLNVRLPDEVDSAVGGPFIPGSEPGFEDLTESISLSLELLDGLENRSRTLPMGNPVPGAKVSSTFGNRIDPFRKTTAFHAGIDFRAPTGTPVRASGAGTVVHAGRRGGYGLLVEIDHGNGFSTRYAHLSRISVEPGARIQAGTVVGKVGSTGRSTGPHLHYEIRRSDKPSNPARYLKAGRALSELL